MAAHGRYGKPCPVCDTSIQEIVYAANETNYRPRCQTSGKVLADRLLSRLLKDDWPKTIEEVEQGKRRPGGGLIDEIHCPCQSTALSSHTSSN